MTAVEDALADLRADYPGWTFERHPSASLPWHAWREPPAVPDGGGYGWIPAATPERLRELIGGAHQMEAQLDVEKADRRLKALRSRLGAAGFEVQLKASVLTVTAPATSGKRPSETIVCRPRPEDGDRLWFFTGEGTAVAEADQITNAVVFLTGHLAARAQAPTP